MSLQAYRKLKLRVDQLEKDNARLERENVRLIKTCEINKLALKRSGVMVKARDARSEAYQRLAAAVTEELDALAEELSSLQKLT